MFTLPLKPWQFYSLWSTSSDILHLHDNLTRRPSVVGIGHFCWTSIPRPFPPGESLAMRWMEGRALPLSPKIEGEQPYPCPNLATHRLFHDWGSASETTLPEGFPGNEQIRAPEERLGLIPAKGMASGACAHGHGIRQALRVWDPRGNMHVLTRLLCFCPLFPKICQPLPSTDHFIFSQHMLMFDLTRFWLLATHRCNKNHYSQYIDEEIEPQWG